MASGVATGTEIDGFTVGELLHRGGMGTVHRVSRSGESDRLVLKAPLLGSTAASESIIGFETEATILPTLKGPHVPRFIAAGDLARTPYVVIEWIEGPTLGERLARGPLPPAQMAEIGAAIADALHSIHQQGVIHLDLKPTNVVLRPDGIAVLIDFGVAHHARYPDLLAEETRFRAGSAPYVSPEQLLGTREDRRSDLFALGVVLYEGLTGKLPFGEPETDVRNRFWLDPEPPCVAAPEVAPWLQEIVLRCLEPRAEQRYQSAGHLAFDLRHPEQVALTERARKNRRAGIASHLRRFFRARAEHGARLRKPDALTHETPIVLVAVDTEHLDDERHPAIYATIAQTLAQSTEYRLLCLSVIPPFASSQEHLVRLRDWTEPLALPVQRLSLHAVESDSPAETIVELASHNNVDLVVLGGPSEGGRAWSQSVASSVSAKAPCSVHVVRVRRQ
jgi:serine/threonine protein kinase